MNRVRVLQIIDVLGPGGAETLLYTLASGLDSERFDLHVCGLRPGYPYDLNKRIRDLGVPLIEFDQTASYDLPTLLSLVRYIKRHKISVIHTHLLASDVMGRLAGFITRTPVVSTIHNSREDFDHEPRRRQWLERWTARLWCRRLVLVSETIRGEIAQWYGLPESRFVTIANGVDTGRFRPHPDMDRAAMRRSLFGEEAGADGPLIVNIARLTPQKGLNYLIDAAKLVFEKRPDARLAIVGVGPMEAELKAKVAEMGLESRIVFTGARGDIPEILAASDLFVLSSLWEGLPISLLEAMSSGNAVVATSVGGVGAVLTDGVTGRVVPPSDAAALSAAMLDLLNDPLRGDTYGQAARAFVIKHYSMETWTGKLERLYLRILKG